jgi:hypothetical protein
MDSTTLLIVGGGIILLVLLFIFLVRTRGEEAVHGPWGTGVDLEPGEGEAGPPEPPRPGANVEDVTEVQEEDDLPDKALPE